MKRTMRKMKLNILICRLTQWPWSMAKMTANCSVLKCPKVFATSTSVNTVKRLSSLSKNARLTRQTITIRYCRTVATFVRIELQIATPSLHTSSNRMAQTSRTCACNATNNSVADRIWRNMPFATLAFDHSLVTCARNRSRATRTFKSTSKATKDWSHFPVNRARDHSRPTPTCSDTKAHIWKQIDRFDVTNVRPNLCVAMLCNNMSVSMMLRSLRMIPETWWFHWVLSMSQPNFRCYLPHWACRQPFHPPRCTRCPSIFAKMSSIHIWWPVMRTLSCQTIRKRPRTHRQRRSPVTNVRRNSANRHRYSITWVSTRMSMHRTSVSRAIKNSRPNANYSVTIWFTKVSKSFSATHVENGSCGAINYCATRMCTKVRNWPHYPSQPFCRRIWKDTIHSREHNQRIISLRRQLWNNSDYNCSNNRLCDPNSMPNMISPKPIIRNVPEETNSKKIIEIDIPSKILSIKCKTNDWPKLLLLLRCKIRHSAKERNKIKNVYKFVESFGL